MAEMVIPGVYIEVNGEALIAAGPISVGNIGIVGTARQGPVGEVVMLSTFNEARDIFGAYDSFVTPEVAGNPLTLVRALEQAYANGAATVYAVRVTGTDAGVPSDANFVMAWGRNTRARRASANVAAEGGGTSAVLTAKGTPGPSGNSVTYEVSETTPVSGDSIVRIRSGSVVETYTVSSGTDLVAQITADSALVDAAAGTAAGTADPLAPVAATPLAGGASGADAIDSDYALGLAQLTNQDAHIIVAAGQDNLTIGNELKSHVEDASDDKNKRDRIAVVGTRAMNPGESASAFAGSVVTNLGAGVGDRIVLVTPGIKATDAATGKEVTLPGSYAAAAVAGMLSARAPHVSLTNKTLSVGGLEVQFNSAHLEQFIKNNVLALESRRGFRVVKALTTDDGPFKQITIRRTVDYAKFGVRSAADPYIGRLNNVRVRNTIKGSINGLLAAMVTDEMLVSYTLDVSATREEEIRGIARVVMTVQPTFSLDYIQVTMYLG
ncbi:MAG: phage tail sheath C-terminal domain-containing protein [Pyrinomonadaceae bacterium]